MRSMMMLIGLLLSIANAQAAPANVQSYLGKTLKLVAYNVNVDGQSYALKGQCWGQAIEKAFLNPEIRFTNRQSVMVVDRSDKLCGPQTFSALAIAPNSEDSQKMTVLVVDGPGQISALFSAARSHLYVQDSARLDLTCREEIRETGWITKKKTTRLVCGTQNAGFVFDVID